MSSRRTAILTGAASRVEREIDAWQDTFSLSIGNRVFFLRSKRQYYGLEDIFEVTGMLEKYERRSNPGYTTKNRSLPVYEVARGAKVHHLHVEDVELVPHWFNPERRDLKRVEVDGEDGQGQVTGLKYARRRWYAVVEIGGHEIEVDAQMLSVPIRRRA